MQKILNGCESVLTYSAVVATFVMMCLTTADAAGRYIFNLPIPGAYEITADYLMIIAVFLGTTYAYRKGAYIRVTFVVDSIPRQARLVVGYFVQLVSILYGVVLVIATIQQALRTISKGTQMDISGIPLGPAYVIIPIGLFFMSLLMLLDLRRVKTGGSPLFKEKSPTV